MNNSCCIALQTLYQAATLRRTLFCKTNLCSSVSFPGSTTSSCLLFIFPGIFYLKISNQPLRSGNSIGVTTQTNKVQLNKNTKLGSSFAHWVLCVSLGYFSGGLWCDCGSHQLHSYHRHVDVQHLRRAGLPLQNVSTSPKIRKHTDTFHSDQLCLLLWVNFILDQT